MMLAQSGSKTRFIDITELAEQLGISVATIYRKRSGLLHG